MGGSRRRFCENPRSLLSPKAATNTTATNTTTRTTTTSSSSTTTTTATTTTTQSHGWVPGGSPYKKQVSIKSQS